MNITPDIEMVDLALYIPKKSTIIFSDFHIGYEEVLNRQGILVPHFQLGDTVERIKKILLKIKKLPETIIINGDLKHEFGSITVQEWRETLRLIDFLLENCQKLVIVKGNHDVKLGPIARKRNIELVKNYVIDDLLITHGDEIEPETKKAKTIVIGHDHPAISLRDSSRSEKFKCFLRGKYKGRVLIVQPSFNVLVEGADMLKGRALSPYLQQDLKNFDVFVVSEKEILPFGKMKNLRK